MDKDNSQGCQIFLSVILYTHYFSKRNAIRSFQQPYQTDTNFIMEEQKAKNSQGNFEED